MGTAPSADRCSRTMSLSNCPIGMATTSITDWPTWYYDIPMAIVKDTMHQRDTLNHRVPHRALVMLERSAGKLARSVLRGEESREALFLPGGLVPCAVNTQRVPHAANEPGKPGSPRQTGGAIAVRST